MSGPDLGRLRKELIECAKLDTSGITAAALEEGNLTHLEGRLTGPKDTPYEGGVWRVDIVLPRNYPFEPPKM